MAAHSSVLAWRIPGTGSLVGCRLWGRTESDTTEATQQQQQQQQQQQEKTKTVSLEKEMVTHSSILAWKIPGTEEPGRLQLWGHKESDMTDRLSTGKG